jgi:hypothetical protein
MRPLRLISLCTTLLSTMVLAQSAAVSLIGPPLVPKGAVANGLSQPDPAMQAKVAESYGKLPLSFEANHGQADGRVKFLSRTGGYTLFLTGDEAVLAFGGSAAKKPAPKGASGFGGASVSLKRYPDTNPNLDTNPNPATRQFMTGGVLRMKLRNANPAAKIAGTDELAGTNNYFIGNDPAKWRTSVPTYAKVKYEGIYSGIDLVYYGNQRQLEYDFIVAPGADPRRIAFDVRGAKRIRKDAHGDLLFKVGDDEIRWHKPVVYQEKDGTRQLVAARYAITDTNRVGFEVAKYDSGRPLYIDPLIYSTYLGGSSLDAARGIAVDSAGYAYVTGDTQSTDFPTTTGAFQRVCGGCDVGHTDAFVAKINPSGSALVYSTYLGGSYDDAGFSIAVDSAGNAYVTGWTFSTDFPTMNPLQPTYGGYGDSDAFVSKINSTGSALVYSTYLGGSYSDQGNGIAVDGAGNAYVTGSTQSTDFPTMNALQPTYGGGYDDAFVAKINASGSALVYSTYLGGSGADEGYGIAVDSAGNAYVTGITGSANFPTTPGVFQTTCGGNDNCAHYDAFVAKINPSGSALVYSTYLGGGQEDWGYGIAVDSAGYAYVTGFTYSTQFPTKNPLQPTNHGHSDAFVTKFDPSGSALVYSTYLGGSGTDYPAAIAVDSVGSAYVTGSTQSTNFPSKNALQPAFGGSIDAFITKINSSGLAFVYSTYLGGSSADGGNCIAVDIVGNAYVAGLTYSTNFPTMNPLQPASGGLGDAFVAKVHIAATTLTTLSSSPNPSTYGQAVTFTAVVSSSVGAPPDGEIVSFKKGTTVMGTGTLSGGSASFTTSTLPAGTDNIKAVYSGDSNFAPSTSKAVSQVVGKATTTTALTSSLNPSNFGQSVTFTAKVTPQFSGTVKGSVTFYDGTTALKTVALSGGVAKFTTSTLTSGAHSITATYNGNATFDGSSASLTQTVN